jgi:glycine/D-amino acid oxidase-like deaminating enzyme
MVALMNRSIALLDEMALASDNAFGLNRRGYLYVTGSDDRLANLAAAADHIAAAGAGPVRTHRGRQADPEYRAAAPTGWQDQPEGADVFTDPVQLAAAFPYLTERAVGAVHVRRAGWFSAQQLGVWMLDRARDHGLTVLPRAVTGIDVGAGKVGGIELDDGSRIAGDLFFNAAGPMLADVGAMANTRLPAHSEVHLKAAFRDTLGAIPRDAPMLIWTDHQRLAWSAEEREALTREGRAELLASMPPGCHGRPEGGADSPWALMLWEYRQDVRTPRWPLPVDPLYFETVMRGMTTMLPHLAAYVERLPQPVVDGGYYTKTVENLPLIGPMELPGSYVVGALSGFGVMAAAAAGELAVQHALGETLPDHAPAFALERYDDPAYRETITAATDSGQI